MGRTKQRLLEIMEEKDIDSFEEAAECLAEEAEFRAECAKDDKMMECIDDTTENERECRK